MKAAGCAAALEKLKPEVGCWGAGAATAAGAAELPKLKTDGAAGVEVAPPPKVNGLAVLAAGLEAVDPKSKGDAAAVVTTGAAEPPKANGEDAAVAAV